MATSDQPDPLLSAPPSPFFTILKHSPTGRGPRIGRLTLPNRDAIRTPHYIAVTSRGAVPHLSQDNFARLTNISGVYVGLEDFLERASQRPPPLYELRASFPTPDSALRRFTALPDCTLCVLGARRTPPVTAPAANPNTESTVAVSTAVGFRHLSAADYAEAGETLGADIVVGLGDIPYGRALGSKRIEKATDRTINWTISHMKLRQQDRPQDPNQPKLFAPLLPVPCEKQSFYLDALTTDLEPSIAGLALYDLATLPDLPQPLTPLPLLAFLTPSTPQTLLHHIAQGVDLHTTALPTTASEAGIALTFTFPAPSIDPIAPHPLPLGHPLTAPENATSLTPLSSACPCETCTNHHKAYLHHLLSAHEMLGWVLLQIHNFSVLDRFFEGVRAAMDAGTFEEECRRFGEVYETALPEPGARGPRVRGYQFKSEGPGEAKKNVSRFKVMEKGREARSENAVAVSDSTAEAVKETEFAEKEGGNVGA